MPPSSAGTPTTSSPDHVSVSLDSSPSDPGRPILGVACDGGGPIDPGTLRFGQVGGIKLTVVAPLALGLGEMEQILTWTSDGRWGVEEEVRYKGIVGDASTQRLEGSSDALANTYAQWITDANDNPGLKLFVDGLDPDLDPSCAVIHSRVTLEISDTPSGQSESWTRCVPGFLQSLTPFGALPDPGAPRVANLARLARDYTVGESFESAYEGHAALRDPRQRRRHSVGTVRTDGDQ